MPRTTLYLARHGEQETPSTGAGPVQGQSEGGLSARGRDQAHKLGRRLADTRFDSIHHSSLLRAEQTATILAGYRPGIPIHACDLVKDRTPVPADPPLTGPLTGSLTDDLGPDDLASADSHTYPERYRGFLDAVPAEERDPGAVRLQQAVQQLSALGAEERLDLIVTHNFVIGWFVRHVMQAPHWRWLGLNQANCALTVLQWETGRPPALISFNDVGHL